MLINSVSTLNVRRNAQSLWRVSQLVIIRRVASPSIFIYIYFINIHLICFSCLAGHPWDVPEGACQRLCVSLDPAYIPHGYASGSKCQLLWEWGQVYLPAKGVGAPFSWKEMFMILSFQKLSLLADKHCVLLLDTISYIVLLRKVKK